MLWSTNFEALTHFFSPFRSTVFICTSSYYVSPEADCPASNSNFFTLIAILQASAACKKLLWRLLWPPLESHKYHAVCLPLTIPIRHLRQFRAEKYIRFENGRSSDTPNSAELTSLKPLCTRPCVLCTRYPLPSIPTEPYPVVSQPPQRGTKACR